MRKHGTRNHGWPLGWLVALGCAAAARADLTPQQAFDRLAGHAVTGATVLTHGFTLTDNGGGYLLPLAQAIRARVAADQGGEVWLLDYDLADDGQTAVFNEATSVLPAPGSSGPGHVVLLFDWGPESNEDSRWWAESAGDALFTLGAGLGLYDPLTRDAPPLHFIGHSFGTVATTEAVERLAGYGVGVDQVTLLDPHDFDQANVPFSGFPNYDGLQGMSALGAPAGYGATIWSNVESADVYYQTRGTQGGLVSVGTADPEGRPLPGAVNRHLDAAQELPAGNPYGFFGTDSDHGYVWNRFYLATVTGSAPTGAFAPAGGVDYAATGWAHSVNNPARVPLGPENFYGADQAHEHSSPTLVIGGAPNATGLASLGLTAQQVTDGAWAPEFQPGEVANGDFESGYRASGLDSFQAGWSHHGGGGDSNLLTEGGNRFMRLDAGAPTRTHNLLYLPDAATGLAFDLRVATPSAGDVLSVLLGETLLGTLDLGLASGWAATQLPLPLGVGGTIDTLSFVLSGLTGAPVVDLDNVRFALPVVPGDYNGDGAANAADYVVWRDAQGDAGPALAPDGNRSGAVDDADFFVWRNGFSGGGAPASQAPEPLAPALLLTGVALTATNRRRRVALATCPRRPCPPLFRRQRQGRSG